MRRFVSYGPALVVLMTVVAVLLAGPAAVRRINSANTEARIILAQRSLDDDDILERLNRAVRNVADTVRPSVVHIEVIPEGGRRSFARSTGTGWVFDEAGHIVTNAHVVRGAARIDVTFPDGRVVQGGKIQGQTFVADPFTDIAVIKVAPGDDVFPIRRATGVQPRQGDRVFVFGSPFGFKFSMSEGIISGTGRDPQAGAAEFNGFTNFIQTDAAVNPGNSGGPLVDIKGRVIGMNVAIATGRNSEGTTADEGQSAGISFAIPLGTIESVVTQLIDRGEVRRGLLGVSWRRGGDVPPVYEAVVKASGVRVDDIAADGPAAKAGLEPGDVILSIAGQPTPNYQVLRSVITTIGPGERVAIKVVRDGEVKDFDVTLGEFPAETIALTNTEAARMKLRMYGVLFEPRQRLRRAGDDDQPPVLRTVLSDSPAEAAGLQAGQLIIQVGDKPVHTVREACLAAVDQGLLLGRRVRITVVSEGEESSPPPKEVEIQILR